MWSGESPPDDVVPLPADATFDPPAVSVVHCDSEGMVTVFTPTMGFESVIKAMS